MAGSLTSQTIEITLGTIDVIKQTLGSWVHLGSVDLGTVGTAGTSLATFGEEINAKQMVLVPRGDQLEHGIAWSTPTTVYTKGSEGVWDTATSYFGCVVGTGTNYFMYQAGMGTVEQIVKLESDDGIVWGTGRRAVAFNQEGSWDTEGLLAPSVLIDGGTIWKMWMESLDLGFLSRIMYATSADGKTWTVPVQSMNVGGAGSFDYHGLFSPSVIRDGAGFKMVYTGYESGALFNIGFATSTDGISWSAGTQIISFGSYSPWDDTSLHSPHLATSGTDYVIWYVAGLYDEYLNYATSVDCINWTTPRLSYEQPRSASDPLMEEVMTIDQDTYWQMWFGSHDGNDTWFATSGGTPDNNVVMWDMWGGTVLTTLGTSIKFRPTLNAAFVGPAYYFDDFGPNIKIGMINNAVETVLENIYLDVYAR